MTVSFYLIEIEMSPKQNQATEHNNNSPPKQFNFRMALVSIHFKDHIATFLEFYDPNRIEFQGVHRMC